MPTFDSKRDTKEMVQIRTRSLPPLPIYIVCFLSCQYLFKGSIMIVESFPCQSINGHYQSVADIAQRSRLKNDNSKSPQLVQCTRQTTLLWMAKGDGKKKRKKQSPSSASPESSNSDAVPLNPSPMRVSTDINIPIRR